MKNYKSTDHVFVLVRANIHIAVPTDEEFMELWENGHSSIYSILGMTEVSDDLLGYFYDISKFIPSENPCYAEYERHQFGINEGGLTLFTERSKDCILGMLEGWNRILLACPQDTINLRLYLNERNGVNFEKKFLLDKFQKLMELARQMNPNQFIFHYGI